MATDCHINLIRASLQCFGLVIGFITYAQAQTEQGNFALQSRVATNQNFRMHESIRMPDSRFLYEPFRHTRISKQYIIDGLCGGVALPVRPLQWKPEQWITSGAVAASLVLVYRFDKQLFENINREVPIRGNGLHSQMLSAAGSGLLAAPVVAGMYIWGGERARGTALASVQAWGYGLAVSTFLKYALQRHRPESNLPINPRLWEGPLGGFNHNSLPSRHATLAFSLLTVIATEYKDKPWIPIVCYSVAAIAAFSRISANHWPSDVIAGIALGFGIGKFVHQLSKKEESDCLKRYY